MNRRGTPPADPAFSSPKMPSKWNRDFGTLGRTVLLNELKGYSRCRHSRVMCLCIQLLRHVEDGVVIGPCRGTTSVMEYRTKLRPAISVSSEVKMILDGIRHPGQSYDGIIRELLACWERRGSDAGIAAVPTTANPPIRSQMERVANSPRGNA
jgi:hypothetical protein